MKKVGRFLKRGFFIFLLSLLGYGFLALLLTFIPLSGSSENCAESQDIYVSSNGVHLYFVVPRGFLSPAFAEKLPVPEAANFLYFGWGERDFYRQTPTWWDLSLGVALKAALWPTASAMHLSYYQRAREKWKKVALCPEQQGQLREFIESSFRQIEGRLQPLEAEGYSRAHFFFEAEGCYSALYTCNTWVNRGLQKAGIRSSWWTPFDFGVLYHLDRLD